MGVFEKYGGVQKPIPKTVRAAANKPLLEFA